ncbi:hypothetical protein [Streptomyces bohaiensis]|uniref:hypothetical protein n=1 Tax=Streptomyces bohaiensis TaxID=1431344 RepID=UPI003B827807
MAALATVARFLARLPHEVAEQDLRTLRRAPTAPRSGFVIRGVTPAPAEPAPLRWPPAAE